LGPEGKIRKTRLDEAMKGENMPRVHGESLKKKEKEEGI